ncbi:MULTISPECIES: tRNA (adenosine(37)-N6)-dimethylallyltransferase MiaA [Sphingobium]|jgi:tRNA dimethylallyltransferase|uniref:tRNA dimethylallyltransferase n=1 Tax=Sphingobium fuliginis (strain ATCC 27551) TaxID=336203 RepID=A0A292ZFG8_SPHSA|nr:MULTISPECIES: tRNA (adenosine(37)-N6)-dimethylallyltransferase MiaA [Sphingobium]QOT72482.1 tRNA (adenosine(37)-N6)-dimethylallyltransferase MiaA [Sphingobium fuliginis]GAY21575.1 tRNA dimethylallyltransferase [Sphingobium fuliginis]
METPDTSQGESRPRVALIAGPTASGKSALAVRLARAANGIVINADASQVYADLQILSARPSLEEMAGIPHRLFGHIDGAEACTAARWAAEARDEIGKAHEAGRLPILVGGTGLYLRTLLDGIAPVPDIDPAVRAATRALPVAEAHAALAKEDPAAAARLAPADTSRVARALEVVRSTGQPLSEWQRRKSGGIGPHVALSPMILLPPRDWLIARCDLRFGQMVDGGAVAEVEALLARDLSPDLPVMRAIGVPEIAAWMAGQIDRETMMERGRIATRQYAKRQYTWFSRQPPPEWPREARQIDVEIVDELAIKLQR